MKFQTTVTAMIAVIISTSAFAQSATPEPTSRTVVTDAEGKNLIGAAIGYNAAAGGSEGNPETVYVLDNTNVKKSGSWNATDSAACKASGGIEIPLPAGRVGCIRL